MEDVFIKYISAILYYFISFQDITSIQKANLIWLSSLSYFAMDRV